MSDKPKAEEIRIDPGVLLRSAMPYVGIEHVMIAATGGMITMNFIQIDYGRLAFIRDEKMEGTADDPENLAVVARIRMTRDTYKHMLETMNEIGARLGLAGPAAVKGDDDVQE